MRHFLSALAVLAAQAAFAVDVPDAAMCTSPPPPGTGLSPDGRGIVHTMQAGYYTFHGAVVRSSTGPIYLLAGEYAAVAAHNSTLEWTRPDGVREVVPSRYLYPIEYFNPR